MPNWLEKSLSLHGRMAIKNGKGPMMNPWHQHPAFDVWLLQFFGEPVKGGIFL
jgi:hypothetical protein